MPEELYNSHDYCLLVDEYEALKLENEELIADKIHLINAAMDGGDKYHYAAHDIGYRYLERKCKALEADYAVSNRELLILQVEISRLNADLARRDEIIARLKEDAERLADGMIISPENEGDFCSYCGGMEHVDDCPITLHSALMKELE